MNVGQALLYFVGAILVIAGLVMLFFETGLAAWVPAGIALAGLVILVGLMVIGLSDRARGPRREHYEEEHHHHEPREHRH